jgi:thioester reductase-like protein
MNSIIDYVENWAEVHPEKCFASFLDVQGKELETYTYLRFHERTRHLAEYLLQQVGLRRGDRALLVYSPGLELIVAFVACARVGVIPVPVYPLLTMNFEGSLAKLAFVAHDSGATTALTTREIYQSYRMSAAQRQISSFPKHAPVLPEIEWITTDDVRGQASSSFRNAPDPIMFLQYTSGSTSDPKGVIVSHKNVIHNCRATLDHVPTGVSWLPQYHDMGLIGYYLFPLITGGTTYGFSPIDFLKRPVLWFQTLSRVRGTYASSPNFGFEYCLRENKISADQLADVDLSSLRVLMNASEPVRPETYSRFFERFAPYGLRPEVHLIAYGLAENTLAVTHRGRRLVTVNKRLLQDNLLRIENVPLLNHNQVRIASCGKPLEGIHVRIVEPKSRSALGNRQVGEIWIAGESACQGYWNRPELTQEVFGNAVVNDPEDHNAYLRTGDLGFLDRGELFVCGRIKDLIIIRGVNYYPQDIESIVESASQKIRAGGVAAFNGNGERETLVVVAEMRKRKDLPDPAEIIRAIRTQYYISPHTIVFVPPRTITKTTSGKIARSLTRQRWLKDELPVIATHVSVTDPELSRARSAGLGRRFRYLLEQYNLTGHEEHTLAEIGIDSLALVMLLDEIEQLLKERGAANLVTELDGRLLQHLTVAQFFSLFDQFEKVSEEGIALQFLKDLKQVHDAHQRDCMRNDAKLGSIELMDLSKNDRPLTNVLLTGPTGFFGPFLLRSLLAQTPYTYYALTRATNPVSGMERIRDSLRRARIWTPVLDAELERRVHVVCGDITQHNLGMRAEEWKFLTARVQAVIHNAALVNYVLNYDALRPHNVDGTRELLRFSYTGTQKEFHFISSTIIFGWASKRELMETDSNEDMLNLDFGYAQTKWVAEQLVFAAENQGLKVRVYRPAFISASTCGTASTEDLAIRLLAFMINHGVAVNALNQISFLPADVVADNITAIFKQPRTACSTFHVTVDSYYNMIDITRLITQEYGYHFVYYDIPSFIAETYRRCTKADPLYPLLDFFKQSQTRISAMQHKRYNNNQYRQAKGLSGQGCEEPTLKDTVSYLMSYMLREGIINVMPPLWVTPTAGQEPQEAQR